MSAETGVRRLDPVRPDLPSGGREGDWLETINGHRFHRAMNRIYPSVRVLRGEFQKPIAWVLLRIPDCGQPLCVGTAGITGRDRTSKDAEEAAHRVMAVVRQFLSGQGERAAG